MGAARLRIRWSAVYLVAPIAYVLVFLAWNGTAGALAYFLAAFLSALILLWLLQGAELPFEAIGLSRRIRGRDLLLGLGGFLVAGSLWQVFDAASRALGSSMFWQGDTPSPTALPLALLIAYYVGAVVAVPFAEELWFRGYGMGLLRHHGVAPWLRVGFTSIVFAAFHLYGGPGFAAFILVWSIVAGIVYHIAKTLWAPLIMHTLNNTFAHVVVPLVFAE